MKYSFMSFSTPTLSLVEMIEVADRFGYDGIEPRLDCGHAHGIEVDLAVEQRLEIRDQVQASGIELACLATSLSFADPAATGQMVRQAHERIDLAGDLGVPSIRVFGGRIPELMARQKAADLLIRSLREVADHAKDRAVTICIETHDDWCNPHDLATVLKYANHPAIAANWDIMHPVRSGGVTMDEAFEALRPWVRHLHIHDGSMTSDALLPIGTGDIDHRRAIELLSEIAYDGFISGEWIDWEPYEVHLPRELETMRRFDAQSATD